MGLAFYVKRNISFVVKLGNRKREDKLFFSKSKIMEKEKGINSAIEFCSHGERR